MRRVVKQTVKQNRSSNSQNSEISYKNGTPNGIRIRVAGLKGRCPRPLDDGGTSRDNFNKNTAKGQFRA